MDETQDFPIILIPMFYFLCHKFNYQVKKERRKVACKPMRSRRTFTWWASSTKYYNHSLNVEKKRITGEEKNWAELKRNL